MKTSPYCLGIVLLSGLVLAQEEQPTEAHRPPPPIIAILDADRDGVISDAEMESAAETLAKLDRNHDGEITREELQAPPLDGDDKKPGRPPGAPPGHRLPPPVIAALDTDRDGLLSSEEIQQAPDSLLELDANGDGELSPHELHPHGPPPPPPAQAGEPE